MVQLGLAEMGFFLACCDDAYIALLEALVPESEPLKVLLGYVHQAHGMTDERYARIRALAPDLNGDA